MNEGLLNGNSNGYTYGFLNLFLSALGSKLFITKSVGEILIGKIKYMS